MLKERLQVLYPGVSGRRLKQWLAGARVRVNGVVVRRGDSPVGSDDRVELGASPPASFPTALRLVHEDEHLLVVDKPAALLTIATAAERRRTVYRLLSDWVRARGGRRIFVVHRLDRETSGLLVFAKSFAVKRALQAQFEARTPERVYAARGLPVGPRPRRTILSALESRATFVSEECGGLGLAPMPDATDAVRGPPPTLSCRVDRWSICCVFSFSPTAGNFDNGSQTGVPGGRRWRVTQPFQTEDNGWQKTKRRLSGGIP